MSDFVFLVAYLITFCYAQKNFEREDIKMGMFNLDFIFFQATKHLSLQFFTPLIKTLKDFFKSLFFSENCLKIRGI